MNFLNQDWSSLYTRLFKTESNDEDDSILGNSFALFSATGFRAITLFILNVLIARWATREVYGQFHVAMTIFFIFSTLTSFGLQNLIVREVAKTPGKGWVYLKHSIYLKGILLGLSAGIILLIVKAFHYQGDTRAGIYIACIALVPFSITHSLESLIQAKRRMFLISAGNLVYSIVYLVLGTIGLFYFSGRIVGILTGFVFAHLVYLFIYICFWPLYSYTNKVVRDVYSFKKMFRESLPFMGFAVSAAIFLRVDFLMLSWFLGEEVVGLFGAAFKVVEIGIWIIASIVGATFPLLAERYEKNFHQFTAIYQQSVRIIVIILLLIVLIFLFWGEPIITFIFGELYADSGIIIKILTLLLIPFGVIQIISRVMFSAGKQGMAVYVFLTGCLLNMGLNYYLIPVYGAAGAAIATATATTVHFIILIYLCEKYVCTLHVSQNLIKPLLTGIFILFIPVAVIDNYKLLLFVVLLVFWVFVLYRLGILDKNSLKLAR